MSQQSTQPINDDEAMGAAAPLVQAEHVRPPVGFQGKRFMLTLWDDHLPDDFNEERLYTILMDKGAKYCAYGHEQGGKSGRAHWHVYVRWETKRNSRTVCNYFKSVCGKNLWCGKPRGDEKQVRDYCWCEGDHVDKAPRSISHGQYPEEEYDPLIKEQQGKRSDLEAIAQAAADGKDPTWIAERYPGDFIRYHAGITKLCSLTGPKPPAERDVEIFVMWGPTGTGKTHRTMTTWPNAFAVIPGRDPWGMYNGEETIFFDEFDPSLWPVTAMNRYLDKWRVLLDARYNNKYGAWTRVVICANSNPASWYADQAAPLQDAFRRRIRGRCWAVNSQEPTMEEITQMPPTPL